MTPTKTRPSEEPLLEHKCSNRGSRATVEDDNRGILANAHDKRIHKQIETPARRSDINTRSPGHGVDRGLEHGNRILQIDRGSIASDRRIRKWLERADGPRAQKRLPPPITGTKVRTFNVTAMLPPNTTVTGSVIGEQEPIKSPLFPALSP